MFLRRWVVGGSGAFLSVLVLLGPPPREARAEEIDWPALDTMYEGATFVKDTQVCQQCHEDDLHGFAVTPHARVFRSEKMPERGECETCHGPASKHVEDSENVLHRPVWNRLSAAQQSAVCMQCHEGGARMGWKAGVHSAADVSCSSCHHVMAARSERFLLAGDQVPETCYSCHGVVRGQMSKSSHHPVREGLMDCASCHNPHGSTPGLMRTSTINETCVECHAEKRGPFVWEHAPVRESCANCHEAHGSSNRNLLARKDPFLCLSCHSYGGHVNLPRYNRVSTPSGSGCVNCHVTTHGSNHPSGAKQTR